MSNLFYTLEIEAFRKGITLRTAESREWFRRKAATMRRVNRSQLMKSRLLRSFSHLYEPQFLEPDRPFWKTFL